MAEEVRRAGTALGAVVALLLALAACATEPQDADDGGADEATTEPAGADGTVEIPDTPVGLKTQWLLEVLNAEEDTTEADWQSELHPDFLAEVSAAELVELLNSNIRPAQPWVPTAYEGAETQAVTTIEPSAGEAVDMSLALDADGLITGLLFAPAQQSREPAESFDELEDRLEEIPGEVRALVQQEDDGEVTTLVDLDSSTPAPLASVFKLYVLTALIDAVQTGATSWDTTLTVTDELRSLPSGTLQEEPAGTEITVRDAAQWMIEISDNTATDLIVDHLGRETVEATVAGSGHHDPELLQPFLTTRELFQLRWGAPELAERWEQGGEDERRQVLEEVAELPLTLETSDITPDDGWQRGLEWYASAADVAAAHEGLAERAEEHEELDEILGANAGIMIEHPEMWEQIAFKGGSSPGVLTGSWHAEHRDGTVLTVVLLASHENATGLAQSQVELFGLARDAFALSN